MSEYQFIAFRAVDRPLDDQQLEFAEQQSSRAELSRWEMTVEYHYSDFRGDVDGLLQRGFDVFLRYANFGIHEIRMRLPQGLPLPKKMWKPFVDGERLSWNPDKKGKAGILCLCPFIESGDIEQMWGFDSYLNALVGLRRQLMMGDPRPLYVMWLCASIDGNLDFDDTPSCKAPAGVSTMTDHAHQLLEFYGLDPLLLLAAGEETGPVPDIESQSQQLDHWMKRVSQTKVKELLTRFLTDDPTAVKAELMAEIRDCQNKPTWPLGPIKRSLADLINRAEELRLVADEKAAKKAAAAAKRKAAKVERARQTRMKKMVTAPKQWLRETDKLANARGTDNYEAAADILADLKDAIGGAEGKKITRKHAAHLAKKHPTLNRLKSSLRKRGLLD